jgi:peptidoglycan hydrolase-like protein with peptidoglycan-binding domain
MRKNNLYAFDRPQGGAEEPPGQEAGMSNSLKPGNMNLSRVTALQRRLVELGYKLGRIDGKFGSLTAGALLAFQHDNGLPTTGVYDAYTEAALSIAQPRPLDQDRITATEQDLASGGSRIVKSAVGNRILSWIAAAFGAIGLGNSAVVNASGSTTEGGNGSIPNGLLTFLDAVQNLGATPRPDDVARLAQSARALREQLAGISLPPDVANALNVLRTLPTDTVSNNPTVLRAVEAARDVLITNAPPMRTILDIVPTFFKDGSTFQAIMQGVAGVGASTIPGFAGSLAMLGLGLFGRVLSNRIVKARVEDHRTAANIAPIGN